MHHVFSHVLGRTLPDLVLGTWQLGGAYQFGGKADGLGPMEASTARALIDAAYQDGIRLFDTADIYGRGAVESLLSSLPADAVVVTKFGNRGDAEVRGKDFGRAYLEQCLQSSAGRLRRVPDLVLMHNPGLDYDFSALEALDLDGLRSAGLLRGFGVSCTTVAQARQAVERPEVRAVEVNFNLLDSRARDELFGRAEELAKDVLLRAPLCSGFLTERFLTGEHAFHADDRRASTAATDRQWRIDSVRKLAAALAPLPISELAVRYCLSFGKFVVAGCRNTAQLHENIAHARAGPLDEVTLERVHAVDLGRNPAW